MMTLSVTGLLGLMAPKRVSAEEKRNTRNRPYVEPDLVVAQGILAPVPSVIVVSAPAAGGKSALARHLAFVTGHPLLDLSDQMLGSHSISGMLVDRFAFEGFADILGRIHSGRSTVILDSADEAHLRSGTSAYLAAMQNLAELVSGPRAEENVNVAAVIFARPETAELTFRALTEHGVPGCLLDISPLNSEQAVQLLRDEYAFQLKGHSRSRTYNDYMAAAYSGLLSLLASGKGRDLREGDSAFLGYPPVLQGVASLVARAADPFDAESRLNEERLASDVLGTVYEVASRLLSREQRKFEDLLRPALSAHGIEAGQLYSPEAQVGYLLGDLDRPNLEFAAQRHVPPEIAAAVRIFIREHPFLGQRQQWRDNPLTRFDGIVVRDFVAAWALTHGSPIDQRRLVLLYEDAALEPSPMLFAFIFREGASRQILPSECLSPLVDSANAYGAQSRPFTLVVTSSSSKVFELRTMGRHGERSPLFVRFATAPSRTVRFGRGISHAEIRLPHHSVSLGVDPSSRFFTIGPDVSLTCHRLSSEVRDIRVYGNVRMEADEVFGKTGNVVASEGASLQIRSKSVTTPWRRFRVE